MVHIKNYQDIVHLNYEINGMDANAKDEIRKKIKSLISSLHKEIEELEELTKPVSPENSIGRLTRMDAINNKSVAEASLRNRKRKLGKLKVAINKIDDEDFGVCIRCKSVINPQRIILMPESEKCVRCASK